MNKISTSGVVAQMTNESLPIELERFVQAQDGVYEQALQEIRNGRKETHWMWYVFPQLDGLGSSDMARRYAIRSLAEAKAYLAHPVLGPRLLQCCEAVQAHGDRSVHDILGFPDDMKLRSCATLFARASAPGSPFERLLARHFHGEPHARTLQLLGEAQA